MSALPWKYSRQRDGHLIIGLFMFKHVLISLVFATLFRFCSDALCGMVVFSNSSWNMLDIFPYLKNGTSNDHQALAVRNIPTCLLNFPFGPSNVMGFLSNSPCIVCFVLSPYLIFWFFWSWHYDGQIYISHRQSNL